MRSAPFGIISLYFSKRFGGGSGPEKDADDACSTTPESSLEDGPALPLNWFLATEI
jgi:hypothetical protein